MLKSGNVGANVGTNQWETRVDTGWKSLAGFIPDRTHIAWSSQRPMYRGDTQASVVGTEAEAQAFGLLPIKAASSKSPGRPPAGQTYIRSHRNASGSQTARRVARRRQAQASPAVDIFQ